MARACQWGRMVVCLSINFQEKLLNNCKVPHVLTPLPSRQCTIKLNYQLVGVNWHLLLQKRFLSKT